MASKCREKAFPPPRSDAPLGRTPSGRGEPRRVCIHGAAAASSLLALALALPVRVALADPVELKLDRDGGPKLSARAVLVLDNKSGNPLLARNANEVRSIASLTKLQATLVFLDRGLKLDQGTEINRDDWKVALDGCRTRLELKWTYRNRDLLHAALMASDNRAVSALGRAAGLNANDLVQAMNERARRVGLKKTEFKGPVGIEPTNVSTAWEVSRIVREAAKNRDLTAIMGKAEVVVKPMHGYLKVIYKNTNPLVGSRKDVVFLASKTGYNAGAGYCLASVIDLKGRGQMTVVLLGCKRKEDRVIDFKKILRWLQTGGRQKTSS
jgi:serine-type D-Ala-D-Ala endopeptidase (penicillin-binding protein 7)